LATIVLVGIADDINALVGEHASVSRNITEIKMPRMSKQELNMILDKRFVKLGMKISGDARWKIVTLSRGLPTYIHALGRDAARSAVRSRRLLIDEADVDIAIKAGVATSDETISRGYSIAVHSNRKNTLYREVLLACAIANSDDEGRFMPSDVVQPLSSILGRTVRIANFSSHLEEFCSEERGNILEKTRRSPILQVPIF
jgi:hypothetical protein